MKIQYKIDQKKYNIFYKRNIEIFEKISNQIILKNIIAPRNCSVDELNSFLDEQGLF